MLDITVTIHPFIDHVDESTMRDLENDAAYAVSRLPSKIESVLIEIIPHRLLNGHDQSWGYMGVASGSQTILLSDKLLEGAKDDRRLHLFHEIWHLHEDLQCQSSRARFEPGFHTGSDEAWRFAYGCLSSLNGTKPQIGQASDSVVGYERAVPREGLFHLLTCRIRDWFTQFLT